MASKYYTLVNKKKMLSSLLDTIWNDFWSLDNLDGKTKKKMIFMYNISVFVSNVYGTAVTTAGCLFVVQAALKDTPTLVMEFWVPNKEALKITPYYQILFVAQTFFLFANVELCVIPCDKLFIVFTSIICVQFKMLRRNLLNISDKNSREENHKIIRKCVIHHNLLLR